MANPEHVKRLVESTAEDWNDWRHSYPYVKPDLSGVALGQEFDSTPSGSSGNFLSLRGRNMRDASLVSTDFAFVDVGGADFTDANVDCAWWDHVFVGQGAQPPVGLDDVLSPLPDHPSCDETCYQREIGNYPTACARRCSDVWTYNEEHAALLLDGVKAWNEWRDEEPRSCPDLSGLDVHRFFEIERDLDHRDPIDLSGANFSDANLRGAEFREVRLDGATFKGADLRCSEWNGIRATRLNCVGADLRNAKMSFAHLENGDFDSARTSGLEFSCVGLSNANLERADLRGNNFWLSDLNSIDLSEAHLCGAEFAETNLIGANLFGSRLWKTKLFKQEHIDRFADKGNVTERTICDVASLFQALSELRRLTANTPNPTGDESTPSDEPASTGGLFYRGHRVADWGLNPTIVREEPHRQREAELMSQLETKHPEAFRQDTMFFQRLVRARHFELPTRLMDVSSDPLIALYYASAPSEPGIDGLVQVFVVEPEMMYPFDSDTVSLVANFTRLSYHQQRTLLTEPLIGRPGTEIRSDMEREIHQSRYQSDMKRLIHFIAREKPYWEDRIRPVDLFKVLLVKPEWSFERLKAHSGAFLMSAYHDDFDPAVVNSKVPGSGMYHKAVLRVPHHAKPLIRQELQLVGVTEEALKSDLGATANAIAAEFLNQPVPEQES